MVSYDKELADSVRSLWYVNTARNLAVRLACHVFVLQFQNLNSLFNDMRTARRFSELATLLRWAYHTFVARLQQRHELTEFPLRTDGLNRIVGVLRSLGSVGQKGRRRSRLRRRLTNVLRSKRLSLEQKRLLPLRRMLLI